MARWMLPILLLAFAAGTLSILAPCVLPLLPIILASAAAAPVDQALAANAGQLAKQFPQFKGFRQLSASRQTLQTGQQGTFALPIPDSSLGLTLIGAEGGKFKLRMAMPGGSADTTSTDQGVFYVGGMPFNGGTLILAIKTVAVR